MDFNLFYLTGQSHLGLHFILHLNRLTEVNIVRYMSTKKKNMRRKMTLNHIIILKPLKVLQMKAVTEFNSAGYHVPMKM